MNKNIENKTGEAKCLNRNCWLVNALGYAPYRRCNYCDLKFRDCMFLHYQIISLVLIIFFFLLSFLVSGKVPELVIISVFTLAIVYGYFFNKSTDKIIKANFSERKAVGALRELNDNLEKRVKEQTEEIRFQKEKVERAYEVEKKAHQELKKLNDVKTQFSMAAQHHLRTPLTSMNGYLDLLLSGSYGKIPKRVKDILKKFDASTANEIKIVNELLDISQFQMGKEVVSLSDNARIEDIIEETVGDVAFEAEKKGIYIKTDIQKNLPAIRADLKKLKMAVCNIIDNAVKYTQKGGVVIKVRSYKDKLVVAVRDTGAGIPKECQKDLFDKLFERSREAEKMFVTGRGIGLWITSRIVRGHKGRIWVESAGEGKGSEFFIELPIL